MLQLLVSVDYFSPCLVNFFVVVIIVIVVVVVVITSKPAAMVVGQDKTRFQSVFLKIILPP